MAWKLIKPKKVSYGKTPMLTLATWTYKKAKNEKSYVYISLIQATGKCIIFFKHYSKAFDKAVLSAKKGTFGEYYRKNCRNKAVSYIPIQIILSSAKEITEGNIEIDTQFLNAPDKLSIPVKMCYK